MAVSPEQRDRIRDVVLTHAHLDHIAGLPFFIDDLFDSLETPVRIHATAEVIRTLETDVFNWSVYPRFSELNNRNGAVVNYQPFGVEKEFQAAHLIIKAIAVNHKVPTVGVLLNDGKKQIAISGDTAEMDRFWQVLEQEKSLDALLVECAFPNELSDLACASHHLTPEILQKELRKFDRPDCPVYAVNLKPMYRKKIIAELAELKIKNLEILQLGRVYEF